MPPAATATTLAAALVATPTVAHVEVNLPNQMVPAAAAATAIAIPTAAAAATEGVATVTIEAAVTAESTALPPGVPQKKPNEGPTGTHGTMLPAVAPPKMPPKATIHTRTWI